MDLTIRITAEDAVAELGSLNDWLSADEQLRGRIDVLAAAGEPGTLAGGLLEALAVALAPGGVATVVATVLVTWIRHRTGSVKITGTCPGRLDVRSRSHTCANLDAAAVRELTAKIADAPE
ncbi:effector-associated constant component EACC1 [Amycolatopsis regifaucium]|uniref:Uncharacterized protein n=1 Tax=Amycolatopsis regifaucium TaxID=546365 RepID=A0A154MKC9_9PSEU|nr:hypothetical protein [Amycolatopsis regifaucium]KZB84791.1 hypothetical protein AVL48_31800 [Amycolatopsis regifaucium]OKA05226.1 hypothetical protein ATP06_0227070 [Amycolatopsis regifaucium]SFJ64347.1 hypothetical protein SAMN04489731_12848 [Amycolatopsis regifaucium]